MGESAYPAAGGVPQTLAKSAELIVTAGYLIGPFSQ
jgi:hypothetical protein